MIRIRKHGTVVASFATPQEIVIDHANDDIRVGDGTDLMGPLQNVGGVLSFPVKVMDIAAGTLATASNQTDGSQKSQIVDDAGNVIDSTLVGADRAIKVDVVSTVGGGAAPAHTDDAAFAVGTDQLTPIGGLFDDTATDSVDEGDVGALRMTADRQLMIRLNSLASGLAVPITDNAGSITVDGPLTDAELRASAVPVSAASLPLPSGAATEATLASLLTSSQLLDDMIATIAAAVPTKAAFIAGTDGTNARGIKTDSSGELQVDVLTLPALAAGTNNIGDVDILSIAAGDNNIGNVDIVTMPDVTAVGKAAHDAAVSGNPVRIGGKAMNTSVTKVANGDTADLITDLQGALITYPVRPREFLRTQVTSITNTTETTIVTAGGAGVYNDLVALICTNNSDVDSLCTIKDSTAGTTRLVFLVPKRGGIVIQPSIPIAQQAAANNNWTATMGTTATATEITALYVIQT